MLLTGTFFRSLDDKQRMALPKPLRESLQHPHNSVFYLAPGTDGSLALYPEQAFTQLAERLDRSSPNSQEVRAFNRLFFAQAQRAEVDRLGRFRIPVELARLAHLEKEVVLLGVRDHVELWNRRDWEEYLGHQQARYDEIAETAFRSGGPAASGSAAIPGRASGMAAAAPNPASVIDDPSAADPAAADPAAADPAADDTPAENKGPRQLPR